MDTFHQVSRLLSAAVVLAAATGAFAADDGAWSVSKSSGEVWLTSTSAQPASLRQEAVLKPGDTIRTGRNGRVFLVRGEEAMMVAPNSVIALPAEKKGGLSTTIVQQAGTILLDVEKRDVKHFEVETPYLAAVVKGTQFRVTVDAASTSVRVFAGQVEVADFRSGQIAQVMPGQSATAFQNGKPGLTLGGSGTFGPIEQGKPRASSVERIPVPKAGFSAPRNAVNGHSIRSVGIPDRARAGVTRISSALGEVRLNAHKVTHGLAHEGSSAHGTARSAAYRDTVWSSSDSATTVAAGNGQGSFNATNSAAGVSGGNAAVAAVAGSGNGNGYGNAGGNGNGQNGNGNAFGRGKKK
ncbi:FecR domain-containing protein [Bradyrhizobium sp.]|uniref:FecR domain-containing protein n=1 Tax=Bradyrhizobium sp. TaxID=376 RepID=UPI003C71E3E6